MIVKARAPGKVTLFGEHAIVYGYPAIVCSISKYVYVTAKPRDDRRVVIHANDVSIRGVSVVLTSDGGRPEVIANKEESLRAVAYILKAIEVVSEYLSKYVGADISVRSEMPVGAGLGTSAAVSVATVAAYSTLCGSRLSREEIARLSWEVERRVQGIASPMDTSASTYGGFLRIEGRGGRFTMRRIRAYADLPLVIAYVERLRSTGEMVREVRNLKMKYGGVIDRVMEVIGLITEEAEKALIRGDIEVLGDLMNINHGLLEAIGVSNKLLSNLVHSAREAGALGAKITGAGGGGCVIALVPRDKVESVTSVLQMYAKDVVRASIGVDGVTTELVE